MSNMASDRSTMEYDIALTLLSLQNGGTVSAPNDSPKPDVVASKTAQDEDKEEPKNLIFNCVISSEVEVETSPPTPSIEESISPKSCDTEQNNYSSGESNTIGFGELVDSSPKPIVFDSPRPPSPIQDEPENYDINKTRDFGTQTDDSFINNSHNNHNMSDIDMKMVIERCKTLEEWNSNCECKLKRLDSSDNPVSSTNNVDTHAYDNTENDPDVTMAYEENPSPSNSRNRPSHGIKSSTGEPKPMFSERRRALTNVNNKANTNGLVPIGEGNAKVPMRTLKTIDWSSYTNATRKLLTAVFTRDVLASHSLTGKRSPAFPNKPAKKKLNPMLVNDIVQTVVERCHVAENMVRTSITTKCADESKMLRTKQNTNSKKNNKKHVKLKKKIKEEGKNNRENRPPRFQYEEGDSDY